MAQASGMIGRDAVFTTANAGLGSAAATWTFSPTRPVNALVATITDSNGVVVDTRNVDPASANGQFSWDGRLANGAVAPHGVYALALAATDSSGNKVPVTVSSIGTVSAVNQANGNLSLIVNGASLPLSSLQSLAAPGA
jgi:flagellar basal-body rod modification protein FlgD